MNINYTLLENGFDFVLMAIKNLHLIHKTETNEKDRKNLIKYSLLHLSSGIELVFKDILLCENWRYVFANMNDAKKELLESGNFRSIDNKKIIDRLAKFCDIKLTEKEAHILNKLRKNRNKAEHFNLNESILVIENLIHSNITLLIKVITDYYCVEDLEDEELHLFKEIKTLLRKSQEHYNDVLEIAKKELKQTVLKNYVTICPECEEYFLERDGDVKCFFCGYESTGKEAANHYINNVLGISEYKTIKYGVIYPQYNCPECCNYSVVYDEIINDRAICFSCDFEKHIDEVKFCIDCGILYTTADFDMDICSDCFEYRVNKNGS